MYVIVGANGFLGSYLIQSIKMKTEESILAVDLNIDQTITDDRIKWLKCDITKRDDVIAINEYTKCHKDNKIIYLAAYHHPDLVEKNPKIAWNINICALAQFMNIIENVKCFFYPSTDSVYGNSENNYHFKEEDKLQPVNRYGKHKATAECLVNAYGYNVVRFPFLIAPSLLPHKFHFYDQIADAILNGKTFEMFVDSMRSSLDFGTVADLVIDLIINYTEDIPKILNVSGDDDLSKYDIGIMIAKKLEVATDLIIPISAEKIEGIFEANRAKSTLLDNTKVKQVLGIRNIKIKI